MAKQIKSIRISLDDQELYAKRYGSIYSGGTHASEGFTAILRYTLPELNGKFTRPEWLCMIDTLKGTIEQPNTMASKEVFIYKMQDAERYNHVSQKFEVENYDAFLDKLGYLTAAQVYFLQDEIHRFWNDEKRDLEAFINVYKQTEQQ